MNNENIKILIIDDEEKICSILFTILKIEGYETAIAYNGTEALKLCTTFKPHISIVDLQMPKIDRKSVV